MIYEDKYKKLLHACKLLLENENVRAKEEINTLILNHIDINTSNPDLLCHIFATAFLKRMDSQMLGEKNIYLQKFDIPQIVLFYKMTEAYPQVAMSHRIANQFIESKIKDLPEVTLFDIGLGKGKQMAALLENCAAKGCSLKKVHVLGLDPDPVNLEDSEKNLLDLSDKVPFEIEFSGICNLLEKMENSELDEIKTKAAGKLVINAAYALHHIAHPIGDYEYRTEVFKTIKSLDPLLFTLIEPNSDHDIDTISKRFHNAWSHFSIVFNLINESNIGDDHKFLIKEKFFGREIRDMFAFGDYIRSERHESLESWILRLSKAGFTPYDYKDISIDMPEYCESYIGEGYVDLGYKDVPLVGVLAYE